jgi:hypothetical protein
LTRHTKMKTYQSVGSFRVRSEENIELEEACEGRRGVEKYCRWDLFVMSRKVPTSRNSCDRQ